MSKKTKTPENELSAREIVERAEAHPAAVPFLWLGNEKVQKNFIFVPLIGMIIFSILGLFFPLSRQAKWDFFASYALIGFVSYCLVVFAAWPLFRLLARPENYYGEEVEDSDNGEMTGD